MSEIELYNGLTPADKTALLDAKARGAEWVARDKDNELVGFRLKPQKYVDMELNSDHWGRTQAGNDFDVMPSDEPLQFIQWSDPEPVNIDLALAQIAEMESKTRPTLEGYDVEQLLTISEIMREAKITPDDLRKCIDNFKFAAEIVSANIQKSMDKAFEEQTRRILNSPYTEGETK